MAISFADSLKQTKAASVEPVSPATYQIAVPAVTASFDDISTCDLVAPIPAYAGDENWMPITDKGYDFYDEYSDESISTVDEDKCVELAADQINLTQESNSQYIPFQISRYYDGFDLTTTKLQFYYVNRLGQYGFDYPVNVYYTTDKIKFGWLIDSNVTLVDGQVKFEIQAIGSNSKGENYVWKTRPNSSLNVLQSLTGSTFIAPDESWQDDFISRINDRVNQAQQYANQSRAEAESASSLALDARESANKALSVYSDILDGISTEVQSAIDTKVVPIVDSKISVAINGDISALIDNKISNKIENTVDPMIDDKISDVVESDVNNMIDQKVADALSDYHTKEEVETLIANVDISEQLDQIRKEIGELDGLAKFDVIYNGSVMTFYNGETVMKTVNINSDPTTEWTETYTAFIEEKISDSVTSVQSDFSEFRDTVTADLEGIHGDIDDLPETLANNYYTIEASDDKFATKESVSADIAAINSDIDGIESNVGTNRTNIATISTKVVEVETALNAIDKSPRLTYDATYNDDGTYYFKLYEIENEGNSDTEVRTMKASFLIQGGGGGSNAGSNLKIEYVTKTPLVATVNDNVSITYIFSGTDSSGDAVLDGVATWKVGGTAVASHTIAAGENTFDITNYLSLGTQKVLLSITDDAGSTITKTWTVQKIDVRLESTFNDKLTYPLGRISFDYTPYGAISKDVHFILDGKKIGTVKTSSSGIPLAFDLPEMEHGAHLLDVYMTAEINGNTIESNHIAKDIIWYDENSSVPVISTVYQDITARQYDATNIEYTVYDPSTEFPTVEIAVDGSVVSSPTLTGATSTFSYKTDAVGEHVITIKCRDTVKTLHVKITKLDINVSPVTAGLVFDFNPSGRSNNDADRLWSNGTVSMSVSDNFDWVNGGYQYDSNGDQYFCIKSGTSADIDYLLFADDAKKNGKEVKLVFKTANIADPSATFLSCMDNTNETNHIGIKMDVHEAFIYGQAGRLDLSYSEEDIIEFEFNISKNTEAVPMVMGYEDGVSTRPMVYDDSYNFTQNMPKTISLGSPYCDLHIYRFKVYNTSLTDKGILNNFIADARNAEEMIDRHNRNQIYDENQNLDPDVLAAKCPWLRVYKVSAPYFTNNKSDKVPGTTIQQIYKNGDPILDNWTCYNAQHSGQGTSSNNYGASGRNLDFIMNQSGVEGVDPYFKLGDGSHVDKITLTRKSVPVAYLNAKVNIASSNNMTNAMLTNRYNEFNPYKRPFVREEGVDTSLIKDTMEFHNCVIFIQETNEDISTHREFADCNYHFYAIGNIGDSKKTDDTRLTDPGDKYECCVELMDVELPLSDFPVNTMMNAMEYKVDEKTEEKIYTWAKEENLGILYELINGEYVLTEDETVDLNKTYYVDILEHDDFSEDYTYGWRYISKGSSDSEKQEIFDFCKQKWIEFYRFVTTSSDEEFKARLSDYFVVDSALYYYLFTTRYCMVDNRAKNSFWHYGKTGEVDDLGNPVRKFDLSWGYDMDTSLGINNYGKQAYRYGLEDTDVDEKGEEVFREMDSTFFCRIRDLFPSELKALYNTLESKNAWHAESFINKCDAWQSEFPEELWRVDINRKYIRTYTESFIDGEGDSQFLVNMANGKMKYHRRQWERSQEKYMASKYQSSVASSDNSVLRCATPSGNLVVAPNYKLKLTPYAYMYLNVDYGTQGTIQVKAQPNVEYEIPYMGTSADIISVYSSSLIRSFGDLSSCYAATVDTSKARKITELIIGNSTPGYDNPYLTTLTTGANYLLEKLNVENVSGLTQSLNLSALNNLKELRAFGSSIGGVTFADGGKLEFAELPVINALTMKNLIYLSDLDVVSFSNLTTLVVENCDTVDLVDILERANGVTRVRLTGVNWQLNDTALVDRILTMKGVDKSGYNTDQSVLSGNVHVPVIRQQQLQDYTVAWPDLQISYDTLIEQFPVYFVNDDGSVLETQYVDKGSDAVDPTTRAESPLVPHKESSVSHDYTFAGWDSSLSNIFSDRVITATYTESLRMYTIKYVSKGVVMQESRGLYGENVPYTGSTPLYTARESGYTYCLFNRWDKSGFIDGEKTVNAIFDEFTYTDTAFVGKQLADMTPVEIYALNKLNDVRKVNIREIIDDKDPYTIVTGNDVDYDDIRSELIIAERTSFNGNNYIDTGIQLFDTDKDFILAVDYEYSGSTENAVLMQCYQGNGTVGFKMQYNGGVQMKWGTSGTKVAQANEREMIVIRHKKGDTNLTVYSSNLGGTGVQTYSLASKEFTSNTTLVFGCEKQTSTIFTNYATGKIHWAKIWYKDLGDEVCKNLAIWTHEKIRLEVSGFNKYYLSDNPDGMCSFSLLASHLLGRTKNWNPSNTNDGGWASSALNRDLNNRLYNAMPTQIRSLIKKVMVKSSDGINNTEPPHYREVTMSDCYISIPAIAELSSAFGYEPYHSEGSTISYMTDNNARMRAFDGGNYHRYWTRSPFVDYANYVYSINDKGGVEAITQPSNEFGVLIEVSF